MAETFHIEQWDTMSSVVKLPLQISVAITGIITVTVTTFYFFAQPVLPIFYSLARPEQALVEKEWIFLFPAISLSITLIHIVCSSVFGSLNRLVLKLFAWMTVILQFCLALIVLRLLLIT